MNQNLNEVQLPQGATYDGREVVKVLNRVIADDDADTGYKLLLGDGEKVFVTDKEFAKLTEVEEGDE